MKVLITGGTGFLGKATCYYLKEKGYSVSALGRNETIGSALQADGILFHKVDLLDTLQVNEVIAQYTVVVHCAALSSSWGKYKTFYNNNVVATENVIAACLKNNITRLIHISSPSIYSCFIDRYDISENDPLPSRSLNNYIATKIIAEKRIKSAYAQGLSVITLRPQALFGPEDPAIFPRLIKANSSKGIPVLRKKATTIDITYVDNVAEAIRLAVEAPSLYSGNIYNITNGDPIDLVPFLTDLLTQLNIPVRIKKIPYSLAYLLSFVLENIHKVFLPNIEPILTPYSLSVLAHARTLKISAAEKDLNYVPIVSLEEGTRRFIDWWKIKEHTNGH
ncbi:MAG: NAD-dependent epimerase/dehydratase family protein [Fibrobacterales bacterium]